MRHETATNGIPKGTVARYSFITTAVVDRAGAEPTR